MANNPADTADADKSPARKSGEDMGKIKKPQQTDATMAEKDLARGSEPATHARR
jgi:hypothetical protein